MKNSILYLVVFLSLISCSETKDQNVANDQNESKVAVKENIRMINTGGKVPGDNQIFIALKSSNQISLNKVDSIYKSEILKCEGLDYLRNLKHLGFKLLMEKGLVNTGTQYQKEFYLNEQIQAKRNFPNIENFFDLLYSCRNFKNKNELIKIADDFVSKNQIEIEKVTFTNTNDKNQKKIQLVNQYKLFKRRLLN